MRTTRTKTKLLECNELFVYGEKTVRGLWPVIMATACSAERLRSRFGKAVGVAVSATLLAGCPAGPVLPDCVEGKAAPTAAQQSLWDKASEAKELDLAIDGSSSMLGLTGSAESKNAWSALIKGITLSAAANSLSVKPYRVGSGRSVPISNAMVAADSCFFEGCGYFRPVTSSLQSLWRAPGLKKGAPPLRLALSDLEVNNGDITNLVAAIKPHVDEGAVIGILAIKMPFDGAVYNSQGKVIYRGKTKRPIYVLATGPKSQLEDLLTSIRSKAGMAGIPTSSMELTLLADQANAKTLLAKNIDSLPSGKSRELSVLLGGFNYSPYQNPDYQFAKVDPSVEGVTISSALEIGSNLESDRGLVLIDGIEVPKNSGNAVKGLRVTRYALDGPNITVSVKIQKALNSGAARAFVPRGQLPESWWLEFDRSDTKSKTSQDQTDGLLLLLSSLGQLMVEPGTTPAASLCFAFNR